jgi:FKBP-type peptidyl-prolyl cis-trans isomerase (trigger factor)
MADTKPKIEKLPHSRVKLTITVPGETLAKFYDQGVERVAEHIEIKGFRKGHAPKALIIQRAGNASILNEMMELAIPDTYYDALKDLTEYIPVDQPAVDVKELKGLTEGNLVPTEMVFTAEVDVMPEVQVGDYKKIKVKPKKTSDKPATEEIDKTIEELKKIYGADYLAAGKFKDDAEMRTAVEENIKQQQIIQAKADTFDMILEELLKKVKVDVPESFIHNEIHRIEHQIESQAKMYGMTFDDWLKREQKTHESIHEEWRPQAEKAAKVGLALGKIAELEGIDPSNNDASRLVLEKLHEYAVGPEPKEKAQK